MSEILDAAKTETPKPTTLESKIEPANNMTAVESQSDTKSVIQSNMKDERPTGIIPPVRAVAAKWLDKAKELMGTAGDDE